MNHLAPRIRSALAYRASAPVSYDAVLVVDLEATTVADQHTAGLRDVIEIGACVLHPTTAAIERADSVLVRPSSAEITPYCTQLTGITPQRAHTGPPFLDACAWLRTHYGSERLAWASYGGSDYVWLAAQCAREGAEFPLHVEHLDIKVLTALQLGWRKGKSFDKGLAALDLEFEGQRHSAAGDAVSAARLLAKLLRGSPKVS